MPPSIYENLSQKAPAARKTIEEYLSEVVPGIRGVDVKSLGPKQTLEFRQEVAGADPWRFLAANMSDGTLRAFGSTARHAIKKSLQEYSI
jgi:hypothetical protein